MPVQLSRPSSRPYLIAQPIASFVVTVCLVPLLLVANTPAAWADDPPLEWEVLWLGQVIVSDQANPAEKVRGSFIIRNEDAPTEIFPLKVYDPGSGETPETRALLGEAVFIVESVNPVPRGSFGIDMPPTVMQLEETWIVLPMDVPESLFYVVEIEREQVLGVGALPYGEEVCDDYQTFYSTDRGSSWHVLDAGEWDCLFGLSAVCIDDSTYIRLHVRP